jgi:membrane protein implicated in regulation of membrane protease activity
VYVEIFLAVVLLWQAYAGFTAPDDGGRFNWDLYIAVLLGFVLLVLSVRSWLRLRERLKHSEKLLQDGNDEADGIRGTGSGDGFP